MHDDTLCPPANNWTATLAEARSGCPEATGWLLSDARPYLLAIAAAEVDTGLQPKMGPSDLVQESLLEAYRDFDHFNGERPEELRAWLRQLLVHNLWNLRRHYRGTAKRDTRREVPLPSVNADAVPGDAVPCESPSPSMYVAAAEEASRVEQAIARLPESYQKVIHWRNREDRPFAWIGEQLGRTEDAARLLWYRAVAQLTQELKST